MRRHLCILLLLLTISHALQAFDLRLISKVNPIRSEIFNTLFFDHNGLLWIGTDNGLKSFDGYQMQTFNSDAYSPGLLPNNRVQCIAEDQNNHLWIGTNNGLAQMDLRTRRFKTYYLKESNQRTIYMLYVDQKGTLWIGTDGGLSFYRPETDDFHTYTTKNARFVNPEGKPVTLSGFSPKSMTEDKAGNLYVGTWTNGLLRFRADSDCFVQYAPTNAHASAFALLMDSKQRLWIGTWGFGIERLDNPTNAQQPEVHRWNHDHKDSFHIYYQLIEDPVSHTIWGITRDGVSIFDMNHEEKGFTDLTTIGGETSKQFTSFRGDNFGNIWISTWNDGIIHVNTTPPLFSFYDIGISNIVRSVFTPDGETFWIGVLPNGLLRYDKRTGQTTPINQIPAFMKAEPDFGKASIPSIIQQPGGRVWFGSSSYGVGELLPSGTVRHYSNSNAPFIYDNYITALFATSDGCTMIGGRKGVSVAYDGHGTTDGTRILAECDVRGFAEAHGSYWIATDNEGIIRVTGNLRQPDKLLIRQYSSKDKRLVIDNIVGCYEDRRHRLWAFSLSGGLFLYNEVDDRFEAVNRRYHLRGNRVYALAEDARGNLWLTTDGGIVRLTLSDNGDPTVANFVEEDGLGNFIFSQNAICQQDGQLYVGSRGGFIAFTPDAIQTIKPQTREQLAVTNILIDGVSIARLDSTTSFRISKLSPGFTREITIPASVEKFAVEFALLNYASQNRYAYKLEGYNEEWQYLEGDEHLASFENLPSGTYHLCLKAADNYGNWVETDYKIKISILPPWYATWWAYILYLFLLVAMVWYAIIWYKNYLKTKNRLQMTRVFTNITHELLTPLAVLSASTEELRGSAPEYTDIYNVMQNNISRLTRMLRQILEVRKSQAGQLKLKVSRGNLTEFIVHECANLRPMAIGRQQQMHTDISDELTDVWFDADKVDKIIYNLVSNAIKYNKEGHNISVSLRREGPKAVLTVADEGIGMSKEKLHHLYTRFFDGDYRRMGTLGTGIGLSLTHDLVVLHHGTIHCDSRLDEGTTFTVVLPIDRTAYTDEETDPDTSVKMQEADTLTALPVDLPERQSDGGDLTLLVVEDNAELLLFMQRLLSRQYHVLTARNGQQAWNLIQKEELDIVISDVMMPVMDGMELTRKIKGSEDFGQLPVILLTAKTQNEDRNEAYEVGADAYITKPVRLQDLQIRVDNILKNRERIRKRFCQQTDFKVEDQHYSSPDELFVGRAIDCVKAHLSEYDREAFAADMAVSSSTLYKKLRAITGQNINSFIMSVRLKEACRILRQQPDIHINELCFMVGINTPKYFSRCFKEEFGMSPKEYVESQKQDNNLP